MRRICTLAIGWLAFAPPGQGDEWSHVASGKAVVATAQPLATDAALAVLRDGGNAIDAAVAAGLTLGVVDGHNSGIGGGCFFLVRLADGKVVALDGREMAPAAAHRDMYLHEGKPDPTASRTGARAIGIPGSLMVYESVLRRYGTRPLSDLIERAAALAEGGFPIDKKYAARLGAVRDDLAKFPASAAIFLDQNGGARAAGAMLVQKDLAASYRAIAREGIGWFYGGAFAELAAQWMKSHGGLVTEGDFRGYRLKEREPVRTSYRDHEVIGFPPPSSGGIHVAQILNQLEGFEMAGLSATDRAHVTAEAMKRAFADRAYWLGDSDFAKVPRGLLDKNYAKRLAEGISLETATAVPGHATPPDAGDDVFGTERHTTHFCVADARGNWVACTTTLNTSFGSKVTIPGTGILLNNQMDDFSIQPGAPNFFGLVGAEANAIAPGKRPLSSMSPTIVLRDGQPVMSVGAAGGPTIISQAVAALVARIDLNLSPRECLFTPRLHHQWKPDKLRVERRMPVEVRRALAAKGHVLEEVGRMGVSNAIFRNADGSLTGVSDPRFEGTAGALP